MCEDTADSLHAAIDSSTLHAPIRQELQRLGCAAGCSNYVLRCEELLRGILVGAAVYVLDNPPVAVLLQRVLGRVRGAQIIELRAVRIADKRSRSQRSVEMVGRCKKNGVQHEWK